MTRDTGSEKKFPAKYTLSNTGTAESLASTYHAACFTCITLKAALTKSDANSAISPTKNFVMFAQKWRSQGFL